MIRVRLSSAATEPVPLARTIRAVQPQAVTARRNPAAARQARPGSLDRRAAAAARLAAPRAGFTGKARAPACRRGPVESGCRLRQCGPPHRPEAGDRGTGFSVTRTTRELERAVLIRRRSAGNGHARCRDASAPGQIKRGQQDGGPARARVTVRVRPAFPLVEHWSKAGQRWVKHSHAMTPRNLNSVYDTGGVTPARPGCAAR
jgi:hypothetical protein